jgi:rSAM/selenodomain-associated transferase 2
MMDRLPMISLIIPVLNEAENINEIIQHIRALASEGFTEIIVVDGDPRGSTINSIKDGDVRTAISLKGRAHQMNRGAAMATGAILLFLHADTYLPSNAFTLIQAAMNDKDVVGGAFDLGFTDQRSIFRITEMYVFLRTRLTKIPFGDQSIFIRHNYFNMIGGYSDLPLMEDVDLMKRIRKRGDRLYIISEKVHTSARRYEREGIACATIRNWMLQLLYALGVSPERLIRWYRS